MTKSSEKLENLNFVWDENAGSDFQRTSGPPCAKKERNFMDYLDFLEDVAPAHYEKKENVLTRDLVFTL